MKRRDIFTLVTLFTMLSLLVPACTLPFLPSSTTSSIKIIGGEDDAGTDPIEGCESSPFSSEIYLGECTNGNPVTSGLRFSNIPVKRGSHISRAFVVFTVDGPYDNALSLTVYAEATGNAQPFRVDSSPEGRPTTSASVTWNIPGSERWTWGEIRQTPDLAPIIEEIVNRADWDAGNALAIIIKNAGNAKGTHRRFMAFERPRTTFNGNGDVAQLVITYE